MVWKLVPFPDSLRQIYAYDTHTYSINTLNAVELADGTLKAIATRRTANGKKQSIFLISLTAKDREGVQSLLRNTSRNHKEGYTIEDVLPGFCPDAAAVPIASGGAALSPNTLGRMLNECVTTPVKAHVTEEHDTTREGVKQAVVAATAAAAGAEKNMRILHAGFVSTFAGQASVKADIAVSAAGAGLPGASVPSTEALEAAEPAEATPAKIAGVTASMEAVSVETPAAPVSIILSQSQLAAIDTTEELVKAAVVKNIEAPSQANLVEIGKALEANAFLEILYSRDRISEEAISAHEAAHDKLLAFLKAAKPDAATANKILALLDDHHQMYDNFSVEQENNKVN